MPVALQAAGGSSVTNRAHPELGFGCTSFAFPRRHTAPAKRCQSVDADGLTKENLSAHFSKLGEAGYAAIEKNFKGKLPQAVCKHMEAGQAAFMEYRKKMLRLIDRDGQRQSFTAGFIIRAGVRL
ncbi:MAG: transcriptional regulator [Anaerolineales bacterium]|nr:transcriptional regulator [Anaerolineales bacterium]